MLITRGQINQDGNIEIKYFSVKFVYTLLVYLGHRGTVEPCAVWGAKRSPSARARILATSRWETGHPLQVTVLKEVGFQIGDFQ